MSRMGYLLKKFPRLSETFVLGEILAQERRGRELTVFSRRTPDDEPQHPELADLRAQVEVLPGVRNIDPWEVLFAGSEGSDELFSIVGDVVRRARAFGHDRFPGLLAEALWLLDRTRRLDVSHLHVHFATDSAVTALLLKWLGGPTYSITAHAKDIYRNALPGELVRTLYLESEFVVTVCDANVRYLEEHLGVDAAARVRRLYNGIDLASFEVAGDVQRDDEHVLAVGRLVEKKGLDFLVQAAARLRRTRPDLRVTIVGEGESRPELLELIEWHGLGDSVELVGARDQDGVRELLRKATVFCLPCVIGEDGNRDALPTVLLEALAAEVPIVSTPVVGIPEILDGGRVGVLVPERDPAALAESLDELLGDAARRRELASAGRVHVGEHFDRTHASRTLGDWFDAVLAGSPACA